MRVISGSAGGRKLFSLEGRDVRPTTDKVKESVFNIIQFEIEGRRVLDLFAGSGQIGIEALSRGAAHCTFTDMSKASVGIVKKNLALTSFEKQASVYLTDALSFLKTCGTRFDIAFLDPPYSTGLLQKALPLTAAVMNSGGIIIAEAPSEEQLPDEAGDFTVYRQYKYGKIKIITYRKVID